MPGYYSYGFGLPKAVKMLLIVNGIVFLLTSFLSSWGNTLYQLFGLVPVLVTHQFMVWQFFTYMFLHGSLGHIFFNMFALWMFGTELEYNWGTSDFLKFYFICGIGGGVLVWATAMVNLSSSMSPTIGASGAIFGLLVAYGMMWPDRIILIFGLLPMRALHFVILFGALDLFQGLSHSGGGIAYFAHVGGGVTGFIYLKFGWRLLAQWESLLRKFKRRRFTVVDGEGGRFGESDDTPHPDLDEEVNRILDKIAQEGMDSLNDNERHILERASQKKKNNMR